MVNFNRLARSFERSNQSVIIRLSKFRFDLLEFTLTFKFAVSVRGT
jgi:hypothetical protein